MREFTACRRIGGAGRARLLPSAPIVVSTLVCVKFESGPRQQWHSSTILYVSEMIFDFNTECLAFIALEDVPTWPGKQVFDWIGSSPTKARRDGLGA
jgi:hypothetical protein